MSWKEDNKSRYIQEWGNYKSDKYKSKSTLREEIRDILVLGEFSKEELIKIKDVVKHLADY